jgi:type I restriction enzyme S subunit
MIAEKIPFKELFSLPPKNGLTKPSAIRGIGIKFVNMGELFANDRIGDIVMQLAPVSEKERSFACLEKHDLLFARQSIVLAGAGKCSIIHDLIEETTYDSHIIRVRLNKTKANPYYYFYYFASSQSPMKSIVTQGVQAGIKGSDLQELLVDCPPIDEQNRIADLLSAYDNLIENNKRRIELLEESARLLYKEWFVNLRFPGHEHVKKDAQGVPEGWLRQRLNEFCPDFRDTVDPKEIHRDTPYIGLEHMPRRRVTLSEWGSAEDVTSTKLAYKTNDILFGKIRPYFHKVGFCLNDGVTSSDSIVLKPRKGYFAFSLLTVSSDWFVAIVSKTAKEGSKMPRADWKLMANHNVIVPSASLLKSFSDAIEPICLQLKNLSWQNRKLKQARDLLLPKLISGEIAV